MWVIWRRGTASNRGNRSIYGASSSSTGGTGEPGAGSFGAGPNWVREDVTIHKLTIYQDAPPGSGVQHFRLKRGNNISLHDPVTISGIAQTEVSAILDVETPAVDPTSDSTIVGTQNYVNEWITGTVSSQSTDIAMAAEVQGNPDLGLYVFGNGGVSQVTISASDRWGAIVGTSSSETSQAAAQTPWPASGKFKDFTATWDSFTLNDTVQIALQVNGVDTKVFNLTGAGTTFQSESDTTTEVEIEEGDLVNWRIIRTSGTDTGLFLIITFGFTSK